MLAVRPWHPALREGEGADADTIEQRTRGAERTTLSIIPTPRDSGTVPQQRDRIIRQREEHA